MSGSGGDFFRKARQAMPAMPAVVPSDDVELEDDEQHPAAEPAEPKPVQDSFDEQETVVALSKQLDPPPRFELGAEVQPPASLAQEDELEAPPGLALEDEHDDQTESPA